jgi:DNA polymerase-3 subunit delta
MAGSAPVVYIFYGDDEFAISRAISDLEAKLGDASSAVMNFSRLDGRLTELETLESTAAALPFLAKRRIVVLEHPLARLSSPQVRKKFLGILERLPATTALVLAEYRPLLEKSERRKGKVHWLEKWAAGQGQRVYLKEYRLPKGAAMGRWIQDQAKALGGQFTPQAAVLLASLVADDPRLANQEIQKLLAYTNYHRTVEPDDVENLTADYGQGDIFAMVDALGNKDGRKAMGILQLLLEQQDPYSIFGMVVRQFRLLLLAREVIENSGQASLPPTSQDIARALRVHPFVAEKVGAQARNFTLPVLEAVYHRLLEIDEAMKTSQMNADLALDTFVAGFTASPG